MRPLKTTIKPPSVDNEFLIIISRDEFKLITEHFREHVERNHVDVNDNEFWKMYNELENIENLLDK